MSLRNLTVRARNLIGFGLLGLILLVVGLTALKQINSLREQALEIRDVWMQGLDWMGQIKSDRVNIRLQESLAMSMPDQIETFSEEIQTFKADVDKLDRLYESTIIHDEDRRLFDAYRQRSQTYESALRDVLASLRIPPQLMGIVPQNAGGFGSIREAAQIFVANELEPIQSRMTQLNDWLGEEVVRFKAYEIAMGG